MKKRSPFPRMLILGCLSLSLLSLGFSSWILGNDKSDIIVDVGASSVFDPSSIFQLNKRQGNLPGYSNPIEGIKYASDDSGCFNDEILGEDCSYSLHIKVNISEIQSLIIKENNQDTLDNKTGKFTFTLNCKYADPSAPRNNDYLGESLINVQVSASYDPENDRRLDGGLTISSNNIQKTAGALTIPGITISNLVYNKFDVSNPTLSYPYGKSYKNFVYVGFLFNCKIKNYKADQMKADKGLGSKIVFACGVDK